MNTDFTHEPKNAIIKKVPVVEKTRLQKLTDLLTAREELINSEGKVHIEIHLKGDSISISTQVFDNI